MKVVFLHGINDTDQNGRWIAGLNRGLVQAGFEPITAEEAVAPKYGDLLDGAETARVWPRRRTKSLMTEPLDVISSVVRPVSNAS